MRKAWCNWIENNNTLVCCPTRDSNGSGQYHWVCCASSFNAPSRRAIMLDQILSREVLRRSLFQVFYREFLYPLFHLLRTAYNLGIYELRKSQVITVHLDISATRWLESSAKYITTLKCIVLGSALSAPHSSSYGYAKECYPECKICLLEWKG